MSLRAWFAERLSALGLAGLDGVYEYLEGMPIGEVSAYLESLTGSSPEAVAFRTEYVEKRGGGSSSSRPAPESPTFGASSLGGGGAAGRGKKNRKRSRGGGRGGAQAGPRGGNNGAATSYSSKAKPPARTSGSQAVMDSAVERARAKVLEYRKSKKVVNCLSCGYVERNLQEDGACSFCGAPMFPISGEGTWKNTSGSNSAEDHKNNLLEFDRHATRRTTVHDDDTDYFDADSNNWLSAEERAVQYAKRDAKEAAKSRKSMSITLDLAGRRLVKDDDVKHESRRAQERALSSIDADSGTAIGKSVISGSSSANGSALAAATGSTGSFINSSLPGPSPRFSLGDRAQESAWFAGLGEVKVLPVTGRVQRAYEVRKPC